MSRTILIDCAPRRPSDGVVVPVRLVFKSVARANFLNAQWHAAVVSVPAFEASLGFDGRSFGAAPSPQIGELVFALTDGTRHAGSLVWANAAVTIKMAPWTAAGGDPADGDFTTIATCLAEGISTGDGQARVRLLDNGQALRVPALAGKFGSTGDALLDGADALKDRAADTRVPRAWGKLLSIPGLLVDRANGVWLFAGNAATSVQAFYDGGATFTLGVARASLAALQANVPANGAVDYCLDAGGKFLARPWTPPTYPFTAAATFGSTTAADIANAIVTSRTAVTFAAGTVAAFNTLQGAEHGLYLDDDTSVAAALDRLFTGLGAWWRLNAAGTITIGRWAWSTPTLIVAAHRRHAPDRLRIIPPTRRRSLGYARNDRVHSEAEIARILLAGDLAYADGTPVEALKPAQAGADVTGANTAAGAPWSGVSGAGKSEDYATANDAGDFCNRNGSFEFPLRADGSIPGWTVVPGAYAGSATVINYAADSFRGTRMARVDGQMAIFGDVFSVTSLERMWCRTRFGVAGATSYIEAFMRCFDKTGAFTDVYIDADPYATGNFYSRGIVEFLVPTGSVRAQLIFGIDLASAPGVTGGVAFIDYFECSRTEFGATLGANRRNMGQVFGGGVQQVYDINPLTATNTAGVGSIAIAAHTVSDDLGTISYNSGSIGGLTAGATYGVIDVDPTFAGGARTYAVVTSAADLTVPGTRLLGYVTVPASSGGSVPGDSGGGAGGGYPGTGGLPLP